MKLNAKLLSDILEINLLEIGIGKNYQKDRSIDYKFLLSESYQLVDVFQYAEGNQSLVDGLVSFIGKNSGFFKQEDSEILLHFVFKPICLLYHQLRGEYSAQSSVRTEDDYSRLIFESINPFLEKLLLEMPFFIASLENLNKILMKTDEKIYVFKLLAEGISKNPGDSDFFEVASKMIFPSIKHSINAYQSITLQFNAYVLFPEQFKKNHAAIAVSIAILEEVFKDDSRYVLSLMIPMIQYLKLLAQEADLVKYLCRQIPHLIRIHETIVKHYEDASEEHMKIRINKVFSSLKELLLNKPIYFNKLEFFAQSGEMLGIDFYNQFNTLSQPQYKLS